ncbi:MAG: hypothetical protein HYT69_00020 [Candidatus Zambryskibacteria bacterium]|nr:hypothetical protein [Candidatus Zambryskibacteria bacterium]
MSTFDQIAVKIIKEQELIIGPLAWQEAGKVNGMNIINTQSGAVVVENGDPKLVIDKLVAQYDRLFGRASREVCKEAAAPFLTTLTPAEVPFSLK